MTPLQKGAVAKATCTHCKAKPGEKCRTTKGKFELEVPHQRRVWDLMHMPGFSMAEYQTTYPPDHSGDHRTPRRGPGYE